MDSISGVGVSTNFPAPIGSAPDASGSSLDTASIGPAATFELASLQLQSSMISSLVGGLGSVAASPSSMFTGASTLSLLNAQGSSAMAYLAPYQAPSAGQTLDAAA